MCNTFFKEYEKQNGFEFSQKEKDYMIKQDFSCDTCGVDFREHNEDFKVIEDEDRMICYNCYDDTYRTYCSICQHMFDNPDTPKETRLYVNKYASDEIGYPIGLYQVLEFPYFRCSILGDDFTVNDRSIMQVSKIDFRKLGFEDNGMDSKVCHECFDKYTGKERIINNYVNRNYGMHKTIYERGLINSSLIQ